MIGKLNPTASVAIDENLRVLSHLFQAEDSLSDLMEILDLCEDVPTEVFVIIEDVFKHISKTTTIAIEQPHLVINAEQPNDKKEPTTGN